MEKYECVGKEIVQVREDKDLGIVVQNDLKWSKQCVKVSIGGDRMNTGCDPAYCCVQNESSDSSVV